MEWLLIHIIPCIICKHTNLLSLTGKHIYILIKIMLSFCQPNLVGAKRRKVVFTHHEWSKRLTVISRCLLLIGRG